MSNQSIKEIVKNNIEIVEKLERETKQEQSLSGKISALITKFCGSVYFIWIHTVWFAGWIVYNNITTHGFDKYPYNLLTLVVSLEAIFLSTFILISQNQDSKLSESRNRLSLQVALLSEQENSKILELLINIASCSEEVEDTKANILKEDLNLEDVIDGFKED